MTDAELGAAEQVLHDAGMLPTGPQPCPDTSHSPRLHDGRWACPDCAALGNTPLADKRSTWWS